MWRVQWFCKVNLYVHRKLKVQNILTNKHVTKINKYLCMHDQIFIYQMRKATHSTCWYTARHTLKSVIIYIVNLFLFLHETWNCTQITKKIYNHTNFASWNLYMAVINFLISASVFGTTQYVLNSSKDLLYWFVSIKKGNYIFVPQAVCQWAKLYIPSTPNNSNETHTFICLGRTGRFGQR